MVISSVRLLYNSLFVAALFPYSPVLFAGSDIQPAVFLLAVAWLLLKPGGIKLKLSDVYLVMLALIFLVNISDMPSFQLKKAIGPLLGLLLFFAFRQLRHYDYSKAVIFSTVIMFFGGVLQFIFPVFFESIASFLLPRYFYEPGYRGVTSFTPEPAFMAAIMVACGFLIAQSRDRGLVSDGIFICLITIIFLSVLMSKSATGLVLFAVLASRIVRFRTFIVCALTIGGIFLVVDGGNNSARALVVFQMFLDGSWSNDHSIMHRVSNLITVYYTLSSSFVGVGFGGFALAGEEAHTYYQISTHLSSSKRAVSGASLLLVEQGWLYVIFLLILIYGIRKVVSLHGLVFALLLIFSSFTIAFPPFWLILALDTRVRVRDNS